MEPEIIFAVKERKSYDEITHNENGEIIRGMSC